MSGQANHPFQAFPNAYLETDEPPNRIHWDRITVIVGMLGTVYFGLTILALTLFDSDYNPVSQAASDYGVGRFAVEMNLGFFVGGIGLIAVAWAIGRKETNVRSRGGSALFFVAGLVLIMNSYFTTNIEGGPATIHGTIHGLGGFVFFVTAPIGVILVCRKFGRGRLLTAVLGLVIGFFLLAIGGLSGLAERAILLVIFATVILASLELAGFSRVAPVAQGQSSVGARPWAATQGAAKHCMANLADSSN
ncbi:MAG TPA: DUF998 domain-containing protein [Nitrososphaerales archaeon]|nr:DUF998 domain-containing protein [Nitrososphaerales archaeon]